jgi:hypothetical protein
MDCRGLCPRNDNLNRLCEEQSDEAIQATSLRKTGVANNIKPWIAALRFSHE